MSESSSELFKVRFKVQQQASTVHAVYIDSWLMNLLHAFIGACRNYLTFKVFQPKQPRK